MIHVAHLVPTLSTSGGGITEAALGLTRTLHSRNNVQISVFAAKDTDEIARWEPVETHAYSREALAPNGTDIIHLHGLWTPLSLASVHYAPRTVISPHGMLDPWALQQSKWKKKIALTFFERTNLKNAGAIHTLNAAESNSSQAFGNCQTIPNGVNLPDNIHPSKDSKNLLFLGRIHPKKGIAELIQGWIASNAPQDGWTLTIAGWDDGGHRESLEQNLPPSISFAGPTFGTRKDTLFRSASAFVLPSYSEGLPVGILEAWSYKLPVIMTPACNLPEGIARNAAISCEPETVTNAINELIAMTPAERAHIGENGRKLVEEKFTWPAVAQQFETLYQQVFEAAS